MKGAGQPVQCCARGLLALAVCAGTHWAAARADSVVIKNRSGKGTRTEVGLIVHMDDRTVEFQYPNGNSKTFPRERIVRFQVDVPQSIEDADRLYKQGRFAEAADHYRRARREKVRHWILRRSLYRLMACYRAIGHYARAADTLLITLGEMPAETRVEAMERLPLAWTADMADESMLARADEWVQAKGRSLGARAARLLAASVFISAGQTDRARPLLAGLRQADDRLLADMALVQSWRVDLSREGPAKRVREWRRSLPGLTKSVRGGAHFVVAEGYERHGDVERAALGYMQVVILHEQDITLSALACLRAAQLLQTRRRWTEAQVLYKEVIRRFGATPARKSAEKGLREINDARRGAKPTSGT